MFKKIIFPAYLSDVLVRFTPSNPKRIPKSVKSKVDVGWLDSYLVHSFLSPYMAGRWIEPLELMKFGTVTLTPKTTKVNVLDNRLEANKTYYCWKLYCKQDGTALNLLVILDDLTQAMNDYQRVYA